MNKSVSVSSNRDIAQSAGVIGAATLVSRVLGFVRDIVIARLFGVYVYAQAFVVAFKLPNLFRDLIGEGAANAAIVPVMSEYLARGKKEEFWHLANVLMNLLLVVLSLIALAGIFLSPVLVRLIAPGFSGDTLAATVRLTRIIFPYILLIGLAAYSTGILNSLRHFSVPAFAPCLLNISIIVCALIWGEGIRGLATGVLAGGVLQLAVQVPVLYAKGFRFRFALGFTHPAIAGIGRLLTPRLFSSAIYQLNNFVDSIFGSLAFIVGEGAVAALYFSYRLIQFPIGIFGASLSQAMLPELSQQALEPAGRSSFKSTFLFGLRSVFFVMVPSSVGLMVLSRAIIENLFGGGRFNAYSVDITAGCLFYYGIGLAAYAGIKVLHTGFFALKDTATPAYISGLGLVLNVFLNAIFMYRMKASGLALATSVSGMACFSFLLYLIDKKAGGLGLAALAKFFLKILLASSLMAAVCFYALRIRYCTGCPVTERILRLVVPIALGAAAYLGACVMLRIEQARALWRLLARRKNAV
ncbi:MAG: murein biosynthesis integral membrane protein MurJ [Candidatus Omnitrophica bacterium]|nr:murein biosynthesis integral membrane protein MurJ [Candidatus Omnitrophota bacterium]